MSRPSDAHERRAAALATLAALAGCRQGLRSALPDGCRPDVLRYSSAKRLLFIGDAKATETPGCRATRARLRRYLRWLRAHASAGGIGVFALCFGREDDADGWLRAVARLARLEGLALHALDLDPLAPDVWLVWAAVGRGAQADRAA